MKKVSVWYTEHARKDLRKLDKQQAKRIVEKVQVYAHAHNPLEYAKALSGVFAGLYRYRVGEYRVLFERDGDGTVHILTVLRIKHRKDVYR
jgi:mRNA interferase RelE/StbE